ncbi:DUF7660 family protein [Sphaerimonospora thailandensis]|uniref:DUF7660 family protein n=1 Tax=Sphaerimonospora thailandensis TaxID=795644 RepID=UPI001951E06D|nr:hypothetical protein [Sphaerimonospora thailandensis]
MNELGDGLEEVRARGDLVQFIQGLRLNLREDSSSWENVSLDGYLEAMSAWLEDLEGLMNNKGHPVPENPSWALIAEMLQAAAVYE